MSSTDSVMRIRKRNGNLENVDVNKIVKAVQRCCDGLSYVDPMRVAVKTIGGLYDGATTRELDNLSIQTAANLTAEESEYSKLAARLLAAYIDKEVDNQNIHSFSQSIEMGHVNGLISDKTAEFVSQNARKLNIEAGGKDGDLFEFFGLSTVYDRYLLRHPQNRNVIETPAYFFMRVSCGLSDNVNEAIEFYRLISSHRYMPGTPTLFNSGTRHPQMSSCYILDSPKDDLESIYDKYKEVAKLSKFAGGIGLAYHRVRAFGSLIKSTNGKGKGIVPFLKTLDSSVACVDQCFAAGTLVYTAKGLKEIQHIEPDHDMVLGRDGRYHLVTASLEYSHGAPMLELKIKHSIKPLKVTTEHPFLAIRGVRMMSSVKDTMAKLGRGTCKAEWVNSGQLVKGDYVAQVIPTEVVPVDSFTEEDAWLYGLLLGNGHLTRNKKEWGLCGNPKTGAYLQQVRGLLSRRGIHFWECGRGGTYTSIRWAYGCRAERSETSGRYVRGRKDGCMPFDYEDLYTNDGLKHIAPRFSHLPLNQAKQLIRGLLTTDGNVSRGEEMYFTSKSAHLAEGLRYQLLRLGIPSAGQYRERGMRHDGTRSDGSVATFRGVSCAYDVRIPAVKEVAELVGCRVLTKRNWLNYQGCVWSRVTSSRSVEPSPTVYDLKVDGVETYMTVAGLAHNGGRRRGACCVYLETWHADIEDFLALRDNAGDPDRRTRNLNLANWIPDLFMQRVDTNQEWSLFDPADTPDLPDLYGSRFDQAYQAYEERGLAKKKLSARELYGRMMKTLAETGNGWMSFKDACNNKCNQSSIHHKNIVHSSNLCEEIVEVTSSVQTAVCNLGSLNLGRHVVNGEVDFSLLAANTKTAIRYLDRVIDLNFYPTTESEASNNLWRPVGLGIMGLQDVFFKLRLPFDSLEAMSLSRRIQEEIYYHALSTSCDLAEEHGAHVTFRQTKTAEGILQFDLWDNVEVSDQQRWEALRARIKKVGLRNSLLIAIAPTATIASIVGAYECIEPQISNLFKRETLSGEFLQVNRYLEASLKASGHWTQEVRDKIKMANGSVQGLDKELTVEQREIYRTVWEVPQKALIDMAAARGPFVDQSQSLNLFMSSPTIGKLSSMYMYAWKKGLKTTYYLRSRPLKEIAKTTVASELSVAPEAAVACSLENPSTCEACQ